MELFDTHFVTFGQVLAHVYDHFYSSTPYSSYPIVVVIGFVDTLVEVNETDGQATLNVSISSPQPDPISIFEIMFSLNVASVEGSASTEDISQCICHECTSLYAISRLTLHIMNFDYQVFLGTAFM